MNRVVLLIFALIAASGVWIAQHWDEARLYMGIDKPDDVHAIKAAKSGFTLEQLRDNNEVIMDYMESVEGVEAIGWRAEPKAKGTFLVTFDYTLDGVDDAFHFQVQLESGKVVDLDPERDYDDRWATPIGGR